MPPFSEGEVVTGPSSASITTRSSSISATSPKASSPSTGSHPQVGRSDDEVYLGEEVDALVLTKEDQDGRLIMSKKRARFEKAWRRIEAAAESGSRSSVRSSRSSRAA